MRFVALVVGAVLGMACVRSAAVDCGDGIVCAPGTTCNLEHGQCLSPDQLVSCVGKADGELCSIGTQTGICEGELCLAVVCGDGVAQGIEQCDGAPPETTCLDLGYDVGYLGCNDAVCAVDLPACHRIGWKPVTAPSTGLVRDITTAGGVAYAVRGMTILRYRASSWEPIPYPAQGSIVYSLYAGAEDAVWALTEDGLFRFDGAAWHRDLPPESLNNGVVFGSSASDVFLMTSDTSSTRIAMHYDGTRWSPIAVPTGFVGVGWAGTPGAFVASATELQRWSGAAWQTVVQPLTTIQHVTGYGSTVVVSGTSGGRGMVAMGDGTNWTTYDVTSEIAWASNAVIVEGRAIDDLYVVEQAASTVARFDGVRWLRDATLPSPAYALAALGEQMFAGTQDGLVREAPSSLVEFADTFPPAPLGTYAAAVWGRSCDDVFVVAASANAEIPSQILHFDGTSWTMELEVLTHVSSISGTSNTAYATTNEGLYRRSGTTWAPTTDVLPTSPRRISTAEDGTIVVLGDQYWLHVFDGTWRSETFAGVVDVFTSGRDRIHAITADSVLTYDGTSWNTEPLPSSGATAIWGAPDGTLIVVGTNGRAWRRDQSTWETLAMPFDNFTSVHGTSVGDVFAIGGTGTLAHFDGQNWSPLRDRLLRGAHVWSGGSCTYFTVGTTPSSAFRLRRGESW